MHVVEDFCSLDKDGKSFALVYKNWSYDDKYDSIIIQAPRVIFLQDEMFKTFSNNYTFHDILPLAEFDFCEYIQSIDSYTVTTFSKCLLQSAVREYEINGKLIVDSVVIECFGPVIMKKKNA